MILSPIPYFCDKSKEYLDLNQSSNLENLYLPWFDFYKEWKSVRLEHLISIYMSYMSVSVLHADAFTEHYKTT